MNSPLEHEKEEGDCKQNDDETIIESSTIKKSDVEIDENDRQLFVDDEEKNNEVKVESSDIVCGDEKKEKESLKNQETFLTEVEDKENVFVKITQDMTGSCK